jgi:hypothetical protein
MRTVRRKTRDSFTVTPNLRRPARCATVHPDQYPVAIVPSQTIKRFAQTLIYFTKKNVPPFQVGNVHRGGPKQTRCRLLSLQEILFGRKIGVSKKSKREVRHAKQGSDRPGVAAAPPASPEPASAIIIWIAPFAQNLRCHSDADAAVRGH